MTTYIAILNNLSVEVFSKAIMLEWKSVETADEILVDSLRPEAELEHASPNVTTAAFLLSSTTLALSMLF